MNFLFSGVDQLKKCLDVIQNEARHLGSDAACSTLSATRLKQRLIVVHRYFSAWPQRKANSSVSVPNTNVATICSNESKR